MHRVLSVVLFTCTLACGRNPAPDPWKPGVLTLLDPDARVVLAARLETEPWPAGPEKASAVQLLSDWIHRRGIHTPLPFFQRLAGELEPAQRRELWLQALDTYPGPRPFPPREDPTAAWLLKDLARLDNSDAAARRVLLQTMHAIVGRLGPIGDPRATVRSAVADLLADFEPGPEAADLFDHLLEPGVPGAVRARAMLQLGVAGFTDPRLLPPLFHGLHSVQDHINLAPFAQAGLSGARGPARTLVSGALERTLAAGHVPAGNATADETAPGETLPADLLEALARWEHSAAALQDPSLILRTFARQLVTLGEEESIRRLLATKYQLAGRGADFVPDEAFHAVREILLGGLPRSRSLPEEEAAGLVFGEELASRAIAVSRVSRTCHPRLVDVLSTLRSTATVRLTTMDWLAQFRDAALKTALAKPELSAELTNLWNSQETEEGQWRSTAHLWRPLVQVPGTGKTACDETDSFEGMSPDDWLRARIELALWVCSAGDRSPVIPAPGDRPSVVSDWELPWSVEQETARAARASACTAQRLRALRDWESGPVAGCATFECLWDLWLREAGKWPLEAQEKALRLLTVRWDGRLAEGFAKRFAAVAPEQALSLLEWFEPLLPHGVRVQIRDQLRTENCLQDAACLPVLLQAVAFANRREVRSAGISGQ